MVGNFLPFGGFYSFIYSCMHVSVHSFICSFFFFNPWKYYFFHLRFYFVPSTDLSFMGRVVNKKNRPCLPGASILVEKRDTEQMIVGIEGVIGMGPLWHESWS